MHLRQRIERYLRSSGTPVTRFGRDAANDPRIVLDIRNGRELRAPTAARIAAYLDRVEAKPGHPA